MNKNSRRSTTDISKNRSLRKDNAIGRITVFKRTGNYGIQDTCILKKQRKMYKLPESRLLNNFIGHFSDMNFVLITSYQQEGYSHMFF
jgi:hypothetical protein